jgi:hypothetical protein
VDTVGIADGDRKLMATLKGDGVGVSDKSEREDVARGGVGVVNGAEVRALAFEGDREGAAYDRDNDVLAGRSDVGKQVRVHKNRH